MIAEGVRPVTNVRLYLRSDDEPTFEAWLGAMRAAYDALLTVQRDVLGDDDHLLDWVLVDGQGVPTYVELRARPAPGLPTSLVDNVIAAFTRGVRFIAEHPGDRPLGLSREAVEAVRAVALVSGRGGLRGFMTVVLPDEDADGGDDSPYSGPFLVSHSEEEPGQPTSEAGQQPAIGGGFATEYIGALVGRVRILNIADRSDRFVWLNEEVTARRVKVHYSNDLHDEIVQAIEEHGRGMRRVVLTGTITTDAHGIPKSMIATDLDVIPLDDDLPTLLGIVGTMPGLTGGRTPAQFLFERRYNIIGKA